MKLDNSSVLLIVRSFRINKCAHIAFWTINMCKPTLGPQIRRDYPLNLSILLSGGKETNQDSLSSGERSGMRPR